MFQVKEQNKTSEELSEVKKDSVPKTEFRLIILSSLQMNQKLGEKMDAQNERLQEILSRELGCIEKNQTKLKNAITQMKNTQEGINSRQSGRNNCHGIE